MVRCITVDKFFELTSCICIGSSDDGLDYDGDTSNITLPALMNTLPKALQPIEPPSPSIAANNIKRSTANKSSSNIKGKPVPSSDEMEDRDKIVYRGILYYI